MKAWEGTFSMPVKGRTEKPRKSGFTMVIDKGLGVRATKDLVEMAADYIDNVKFTFGTSAFYDKYLVQEKIKILRDADIEVMPGGTFLEVVVWQGVYDKYLQRAKELGFSTIEVSDGTIEMDLKIRERAIKGAIDAGFKVISEIGKKSPLDKPPISLMHEEIEQDLKNGAFKVIVEAREAGKGVGIYDEAGEVKEAEIDEILVCEVDQDNLIWEAPIKAQQQYLILRFGPNVNLGNIPPEDILPLEALRDGLRGDTLKKAYEENPEWR
ncbi:phosphosulfolactate synthase [Candidatus Bipolaricaulota bacterium]|nr:phosphosulfolactate synthase [Candidatus Bipolaricaulota bacterium]